MDLLKAIAQPQYQETFWTFCPDTGDKVPYHASYPQFNGVAPQSVIDEAIAIFDLAVWEDEQVFVRNERVRSGGRFERHTVGSSSVFKMTKKLVNKQELIELYPQAKYLQESVDIKFFDLAKMKKLFLMAIESDYLQPQKDAYYKAMWQDWEQKVSEALQKSSVSEVSNEDIASFIDTKSEDWRYERESYLQSFIKKFSFEAVRNWMIAEKESKGQKYHWLEEYIDLDTGELCNCD